MIKAGFRLEVTSWENDGDFYNTQHLEGLTETQARWLVRFCEQLAASRTHDSYDFLEIYKNIDVPYEPLDGWDPMPTDEEGISNELEELSYALIGVAEYGVRVCDKWKVYFIPFDIPEFKV